MNRDPASTVCTYRWSYPVVKYSIGEIRTCCRTYPNQKLREPELRALGTAAFINNEEMKERRREMLSGIRHTSCESCWKLEDAGMKSPRTSVEDFVNYMRWREGKNPDFRQIVENRESCLESRAPQTLELQLDNVCDLKCIYCNSEYSTRWEAEQGPRSPRSERSPSEIALFQETFWKWFDEIHGQLDYLNIIGGEPLLSRSFYPILERLLDSPPGPRDRRMMISVVSNFNSTEERFERFLSVYERLAERFDLSVDASSEALGERGEYIRDGLKWANFERNVHRFAEFIRKTRERIGNRGIFNFGLHMAQNSLNATRVPEYLQWAADLQARYRIPIHLRQNVVSFPEELSPLTLTPDFADYYSQAARVARNADSSSYDYYYGVTWQSYADFLERLRESVLTSSPNERARRKFVRWVDAGDQKRKKRFLDVFPEYEEFLALCRRQEGLDSRV